MRRILALPALPLAALASAVAAGPVLDRHVWEEGRSFDTVSRAADLVTGPIAIQGDMLVFDGRKSVRLAPVGATRGDWSGGGRKQTADVYRIADPGALRRGATLCPGPARYVVFYEGGALFASLEAAFFDSAQPPKGFDSPGLCATFSYAVD